jgi:hypothetical protein
MTEIGQAAMLTVAGRTFSCRCGANVFTRQADHQGERIYSCNGCNTEYASAS